MTKSLIKSNLGRIIRTQPLMTKRDIEPISPTIFATPNGGRGV